MAKEKIPMETIERIKRITIDIENAKEGSAEYWNNRGNEYACKLEWDKAKECYDKAIEMNPTLAEVYNNRAVAGIDDPIEYYTKAIELNPNLAEPYYNRGLIYLGHGRTCAELREDNDRFEEAAESVKQMVMKSDPNELFQNAMEDFKKAVELKYEGLNVVYLGIGDIYFVKGEYNKAIENYDKAIELNPEYGTPRFNKIMALGRMGKFYECVECFEKAEKIKKDMISLNNLELIDEYETYYGIRDRFIEKELIRLGKMDKFDEAAEYAEKAWKYNKPVVQRLQELLGEEEICYEIVGRLKDKELKQEIVNELKKEGKQKNTDKPNQKNTSIVSIVFQCLTIFMVMLLA